MVKTFLRRPGNKSNHLGSIIPHVPEFTGNYIEPFLGSGAVYLHLLPKKAILNDLNTDIINIWNLVKSNPGYIITEINKFKRKFLPMSNENKLKYCKYLLGKMDTYPKDKRTVMYLILTYCSFSGSIVNSRGEWSIHSLNGNIYTKNGSFILSKNYEPSILTIKTILSNKNIKIYNKDYSQILKKAKENDFVFLDPPYIEDKKYNFVYNQNTDPFDINTLKSQVQSLDKRRVKWMMTQADTPQVRQLFGKYNMFIYLNRYNFSPGKKVPKRELIITNY